MQGPWMVTFVHRPSTMESIVKEREERVNKQAFSYFPLSCPSRGRQSGREGKEGQTGGLIRCKLWSSATSLWKAIKVTRQITEEFSSVGIGISNRNLKFVFLSQSSSLTFTYAFIKLHQVIFTLYKITITSVKLHKTFYVPPNPEPVDYSSFPSATTKFSFQKKGAKGKKTIYVVFT